MFYQSLFLIPTTFVIGGLLLLGLNREPFSSDALPWWEKPLGELIPHPKETPLYMGGFVGTGSVIQGTALKASISVYNSFLGRPGAPAAVPEPLYSEAIKIMFASLLMNALLMLLIDIAFSGDIADSGYEVLNAKLLFGLIRIILFLIFLSGILIITLPTTLLRALPLAICQQLIAFLLWISVVDIVAFINVRSNG